MREWTDPTTGRTVRQVTDWPGGVTFSYFRLPRRVPGGWVLAWAQHDQGNAVLVRPDDGALRRLPFRVAQHLKLDERTGTLWFVPAPLSASAKGDVASPTGPVPDAGREIWAVILPDGEPRRLGVLPSGLPGGIADITCDGRTLILQESVQDLDAYPVATTRDADSLWHYLNRPRSGRMWAYRLDTGARTLLDETEGLLNTHHDASPTDPGLLRYALDMFEGLGQRMWTMRTDGSARTPIRLQSKFEVITHEFWWPDGSRIAYTYQDRRGDPTFFDLPWCEYAATPTRLGLAGLDGRELYLSDPLNHYHTHLFVSADGRWLCGEGTDGHSFVYAAPFSTASTRIDLAPLATVHTPYVPFRGQHVEAGFSHDNQWLLFNDLIQGHFQICAVRMDV